MAAGVPPCSWFSPAKERPACQLEREVSRLFGFPVFAAEQT